MAQRPIWRGHSRLALVSCPVALYSAKHERGNIHFNLVNPKTGNRIRMITQDAETDEPLDRKELAGDDHDPTARSSCGLGSRNYYCGTCPAACRNRRPKDRRLDCSARNGLRASKLIGAPVYIQRAERTYRRRLRPLSQ
jgi:hypothetical protein